LRRGRLQLYFDPSAGGRFPLTGAREGRACPTARRPPHTRAMTGSPLKRQRKAGVVDPVTGELVPFPYLSHPRAGLSNAQWRIVFMIGMKAMLEGKLDRDRERALDRLSPGLRTRLRDGAVPEA
jgi:hypothetical protein